MEQNILTVKSLSVNIKGLRGNVPAVRNVSFDIRRGEIWGLVGESGCGKSTLMLALARLLPPNAHIEAHQIILDGIDITSLDEKQLLNIRGSKIGYIFQDSQVSLNPVLKISQQIGEAIRIKHPFIKSEQVERMAIELLKSVQISQPQVWLNSYPHQLSGGMKQRVMIAIALANSPTLLVADEPTTSLDVTVQSEILMLLKEINSSQNMTLVFITHDLSVAEKLCDRIAVMYAGRIVEIGSTKDISQRSRHPYTSLLWKSIPRVDTDVFALEVIPGNVPNPMDLPTGCKFHPRCPNKQNICLELEPELIDHGDGLYACHFPMMPDNALKN